MISKIASEEYIVFNDVSDTLYLILLDVFFRGAATIIGNMVIASISRRLIVPYIRKLIVISKYPDLDAVDIRTGTKLRKKIRDVCVSTNDLLCALYLHVVQYSIDMVLNSRFNSKGTKLKELVYTFVAVFAVVYYFLLRRIMRLKLETSILERELTFSLNDTVKNLDVYKNFTTGPLLYESCEKIKKKLAPKEIQRKFIKQTFKNILATSELFALLGIFLFSKITNVRVTSLFDISLYFYRLITSVKSIVKGITNVCEEVVVLNEYDFIYKSELKRYKETLDEIENIEVPCVNSTVEIKRGEKVGVHAESVDLLNRMHKLENFMINGQVFDHWVTNDVRKLIRYVDDSPVLFSGSLLLNLKMMCDRTDAEIIEEVERHNLQRLFPNNIHNINQKCNASVFEGRLTDVIKMNLLRSLLIKGDVLILNCNLFLLDDDTVSFYLERVSAEFSTLVVYFNDRRHLNLFDRVIHTT